jgi:hypothetical protein
MEEKGMLNPETAIRAELGPTERLLGRNGWAWVGRAVHSSSWPERSGAFMRFCSRRGELSTRPGDEVRG